MLRDLSLTVSPLLALLLMVLTPVGTGQGAHHDQALDPLFPHVHFADGPTLALRNPRPVVVDTSQGPAWGAGAGATSTSISIGLTPPVPSWLSVVLVGDALRRTESFAVSPAGTFAEPPPDPPPTAD